MENLVRKETEIQYIKFKPLLYCLIAKIAGAENDCIQTVKWAPSYAKMYNFQIDSESKSLLLASQNIFW